MLILLTYLEILFVILATWVITFEFVLYSRNPSGSLPGLFLTALALMILVYGRKWLRRLRAASRRDWSLAAQVVLFGLFLSLLVLVVSRPDRDDVGFFRPPLIDASHPGQPVSYDPFRVSIGNRRVEIPWLNDNEAYEPFVIALASMTGLDALAAYHNWCAVVSVLTWVVVYALLFRQFRIRGRWFWLALISSIILLLLDGNLHRSFGNTTLLRIWQGKVIMWAVLVPAYLLFTLRFLARPSWRRLSLMFLTLLASVYLNRSALFMFPILAVSIPTAYLLSFGCSRRRLRRAACAAAIVVPLMVAAVVAITTIPALLEGVLVVLRPAAQDARPFSSIWVSGSWSQRLGQTVVGNPFILARDAFLLLLVPMLALRRPVNRLVPLLSLTVVVLSMSPATGPLWHIVASRAYWRMYYLLPLPLCFGLLPLIVRNTRPYRRRMQGAAVLGTVLTLYALGFEHTAFSSAARVVELKAPAEYRFPSEDLAFARMVAPEVKGKKVLAPNAISSILGLTHPESITLSYVRVRTGTGERGRVQQVLGKNTADPGAINALSRLLGQDTDFVVLLDRPEDDLGRLLAGLPGFHLEQRIRAHGYLMFSVDKLR